MNNKKKLLLLLLALVLLIGGASMLYRHMGDRFSADTLLPQKPLPQLADKPMRTTAAPDVPFYDSEGNQRTLSEFFGKPIVLNFWASWCGPCQMEMPAFQQLYAQYGQDVEFVMVNATTSQWETYGKAVAFIEENQYTFPVYYDKDAIASYVYGASSLPRTFFIDAKGDLVNAHVGAINTETLQQHIERLL